MPNYRNLTSSEINIASLVFQKSIDFTYVFIADTFLPFNNVAVTIMHDDQRSVMGIPIHIRYWFAIYWGERVYKMGADKVAPNTLVHELTHVWQGQHGLPFMYMVQSMIAQGKAIVQHWDRNQAYNYEHSNYKKWRDYNVEQQGNIVEDWYDQNDGKQSVNDLRYTYIDKVIRAGKPDADDIPSTGAQVSAGLQGSVGGNGYDAAIFEAQNLLVRHGYRIRPDGFYGKQTIDAIKDFQRNHHLKDDGFAGPKTLAKLRGR